MSRCCEIYPPTGAHPAEESTVAFDPEASLTRDMILLVSLVAAIVLVVITAAAL